MVHYGKHIIDPQTGLCEICDRGTIHDLRRGKRAGKQFLYSNQDGKFTYRPNDDEMQNHDEATPRYARKPPHSIPPPARSRLAAYEEPVTVPKKNIRRNYTPPDESPRRHQRPTIFYEVDDEGQMYSRRQGPPEEARRRYLVQPHQSHQPPVTRPTRTVHRRAQTPPPPIAESWSPKPKRQINSDTGIINRHPPAQPNDYYYGTPRKAEMYYLEANHNKNHDLTSSPRTHMSYNSNTPPPKVIRRFEEKKKHHLEPIERKYYKEPEPPVERKAYRKLPPSQHEPPADLYSPTGNHLRLARKVETIYPSPKPYASSPQLNGTFDRSSQPNKYSTVYHIQSVDAY